MPAGQRADDEWRQGTATGSLRCSTTARSSSRRCSPARCSARSSCRSISAWLRGEVGQILDACTPKLLLASAGCSRHADRAEGPAFVSAAVAFGRRPHARRRRPIADHAYERWLASAQPQRAGAAARGRCRADADAFVGHDRPAQGRDLHPRHHARVVEREDHRFRADPIRYHGRSSARCSTPGR